MVTFLSQLEFKVGEHVIYFSCPPNTPVTAAKEGIFQILKYLGNIEDQAKAQLEAQEAAKSSENSAVDIAPETTEEKPKE
jgi:hypothetical protein